MEELKPKRLHDFCEAAEGESKLRRCAHRVSRRLHDGSQVHLEWSMTADPDNILSLDTEAEHGVALAECLPAWEEGASAQTAHELRLELPESHAHHAAAGKFVVGSRFAHDCKHMLDRSFLHRIVEVKHHEVRDHPSGQRKSHVHLATERVPSLAHVVPKLDYSFSWVPAKEADLDAMESIFDSEGETEDPSHLPAWINDAEEMSESSVIESEGEAPTVDEARRLFDPVKAFKGIFNDTKDAKGVEYSNGSMQKSSHSKGGGTLGDTMLNFQPDQKSHMGWNWDIDINTTESPKYLLDAPGVKGKLILKHPEVNMTTGLRFNHSSAMKDLTSIPEVKWQAALDGVGMLNLKVYAMLNTTGTAGVDPVGIVNFPVLKEFERPKFFTKIDFATGNLPMSIEPGLQINGKMYHKGEFDGSVAGGLRSKVNMKPVMTFDSRDGLNLTCEHCEMSDLTIWPPMWIIFTKKFEMGLMAMPQILMRGDFGGLEQATLAFEMRPYMNMTITRDGARTTGDGSTKSLIAYPYRVMGLDDSGLQKKYKVMVSMKKVGQQVSSSAAVNWGTVNYHDYVSQFSMGEMPQEAVLKNSMEVTLVKVNDGTESVLGTGTFQCSSILNAVCHPSPSVVPIVNHNNNEVAAVQMAVVWAQNPDPWFANHIRGVSMSFPSVQIKERLPVKQNASLSIQLVHGGRTYASNIQESRDGGRSGMTTIVFEPTFVDIWMPCSQTSGGSGSKKCQSPALQLLQDGEVVAEAVIPALSLTSSTAMQGTSDTSGSKGLEVPLTVALTPPGKPNDAALAVVRLNAHITSIMFSGQFLKPRQATQVALGGGQQLTWMVPDVDENAQYAFLIQVLRLSSSAPDSGAGRKVGDQYLIPAGSPDKISTKCTRTVMKGMPSAAAPCSFSKMVVFSEDDFQAGDVVVVLVEWIKDGQTMAMRSPPFEVSGGSRRLSQADSMPDDAVEHPMRRLQDGGRRLKFSYKQFQEQWNSKVANNSVGCNKRNLNFKMGTGFLVRGKVVGVTVPQGFPMMGGLSEAPVLGTGWRSLMHAQNGSTLQDLIGKSVCKVGLCDGALPGCTNFSFQNITEPKVKFTLNRALRYHNGTEQHVSEMLQNAIAYAMSMLPEMIDVAIKDINKSQFWKRKGNGKLPPGPGAPVQQGVFGAPAGSLAPPQPAPAASPAQPAGNQDTSADSFGDFWRSTGDNSGSRRLRERQEEEIGTMVTMKLKGRQSYEVTEELLGSLLELGYFHEIEEMEDDDFHEKGPLKITDFWLDDGSPLGLDIQQGYSLRSSAHTADGLLPRPQAPAARVTAVALVATACLVAAVMALMALRRSPREMEMDEATDESDNRALE